jgi:acetoin utilization deacetylase AcuC-like enzyme
MSPPGLPVVYDARYAFSWPGHVFPTEKYRLVAEELVRRGVVPADGFLRPEPATREELLLVHTPAYLERLGAIAEGAAPWDPRFEVPVDRGVVEAFVLAAGGTIVAARAAVGRGAAANLTGGFHHAYPDHGEGFCLLHDAAVAVQALRGEGKARRALFVDLDVHQGNGTIACFAGDAETFTFSIHEEDNYPLPKERGSLDVGLETGAGDGPYLAALDAALARIAREFPRPDLLVYVAGADPFEEDRLGRLALTREGFRRRDARVLDFARDEGAPVLALLAGGYAARTEDVVGIHADMVEAMARSPVLRSVGR